MGERVYHIAMAGSPNVGKSSIFNGVTGLHQHTGNWAGKTVDSAWGDKKFSQGTFRFWDLPGAYALYPRSKEEEVTRDFLLFHPVDAIVVVCDVSTLERNLPLLFQCMMLHKKVILCVNLIDEGERQGITVDCKALSQYLSIPVIPTIAKDKKTLEGLLIALEEMLPKDTPEHGLEHSLANSIPEHLQEPCHRLALAIEEDAHSSGKSLEKLPCEFLALALLMGDRALEKSLKEHLGFSVQLRQNFEREAHFLAIELQQEKHSPEEIRGQFITNLMEKSGALTEKVLTRAPTQITRGEKAFKGLLLKPLFAYPLMLLTLIAVLWLTIMGANYPSGLLSEAFGALEEVLLTATISWPWWIREPLILGVYRVLSWVVSVMLPPMAIFFPLFALLEESGLLPPMVFHLDKAFCRAKTCGKQALSMTMGFACNAAGVLSCRIIDSPRERLLAIVTNNFMPCNGRFPTLIALATMFFVGLEGGITASLHCALILAVLILFGSLMALLCTRALAGTMLQEEESHFILELPPLRKPKIGKVLLSTLIQKTLVILGRAVVVAIPAGLVIWLLANLTWGDSSYLQILCDFLDPFAQTIGLDGVILAAFLLGLPANEIVFPIMIMAYLGKGSMLELDSLFALRELLVGEGWTATTALCTMVFSLLHFPCATTIFTIKKESGSVFWTGVSVLLPTVLGIALCALLAHIAPYFLS